MPKTKKVILEALRERRVFNEHEFYGREIPFIARHVASHSMDLSAWVIYRTGYMLIEGDKGSRVRGLRYTFYTKDGREATLKEAQAECARRWNITEWTRDPWGGYGPTAFVEGRLAAIMSEVPNGNAA